MNTNTGMNFLGMFLAFGAVINEMPDGALKAGLMSLCMICGAVSAFATRGSGLSEKSGKEILDVSKDLKDVLEEDRAN